MTVGTATTAVGYNSVESIPVPATFGSLVPEASIIQQLTWNAQPFEIWFVSNSSLTTLEIEIDSVSYLLSNDDIGDGITWKLLSVLSNPFASTGSDSTIQINYTLT